MHFANGTTQVGKNLFYVYLCQFSWNVSPICVCVFPKIRWSNPFGETVLAVAVPLYHRLGIGDMMGVSSGHADFGLVGTWCLIVW